MFSTTVRLTRVPIPPTGGRLPVAPPTNSRAVVTFPETQDASRRSIVSDGQPGNRKGRSNRGSCSERRLPPKPAPGAERKELTMRISVLPSLLRSWPAGAALILLALTASSSRAQDDPPFQAGRLSFVSGAVSIQPVGLDDWGQAYQNLPVGPGDRIFTRGCRLANRMTSHTSSPIRSATMESSLAKAMFTSR